MFFPDCKSLSLNRELNRASVACVRLSGQLGHVSRYRSECVQEFRLQSGLGDHDVHVDLRGERKLELIHQIDKWKVLINNFRSF